MEIGSALLSRSGWLAPGSMALYVTIWATSASLSSPLPTVVFDLRSFKLIVGSQSAVRCFIVSTLSGMENTVCCDCDTREIERALRRLASVDVMLDIL